MALDPFGPSAGLDPSQPIAGLDPFAPDPNAPGPFARGVKSGIAGVKSSLWGAGALAARGATAVLPAVAAPFTQGLEAAALENAAAQNEIAAAQSMKYEDVVEDPTRVGEFIKWGAGSAIPSLALMLAGGVVGRGLGAIAGRSLAPAAAATVKNVGMFTGAVVPDVAVEAGSIFPEAIKEGVENPGMRSAVGSMAAGAVDFLALPPALRAIVSPATAVARKAGFGAAAKTTAMEAVKRAPVVGGLEAAQEASQAVIEMIAAGQDITSKEGISNIINSALVGAIAGGGIGGIAGGFHGVTARVQEPPMSTNREQPPEVNTPVSAGAEIPNLSTIVPNLSTEPVSAEAAPTDPIALHAAATQTMADVEAQTTAAQAAHESLVSRRQELDAESKLPVGERRTKSEITVEKKALAKQITVAKAETERLGGELFAAKQAVNTLAAQLDPAAAAMAAQGVDIAPVPAAETASILSQEQGTIPDTIEQQTARAVEGARVAAGGNVSYVIPNAAESTIYDPLGVKPVSAQQTQQERIQAAALPDIKELVVAKLTGQGESLINGISSKVERAVTAALALPTVEERVAAIRATVPKAFANKLAKVDAADFADGIARKVGDGTLYSKGASESDSWQLTREQYFNDSARVKRDVLGNQPANHIVRYEYEDPAPSGPFKGSMASKSPVKPGTIVNAAFGKAKVVSSVKAKPADANTASLYDEAKAFHQRAVADAVAAGKPVPAEVLADYPDIQQSNAALTQDEFDSLSDPDKSEAMTKYNKIMAARGTALRQEITRMLGPRAGLIMKTFQATPDSPIGSYTRVDTLKSVITMALNALDGLGVAHHEGFHAAEDLVLTTSEVAIVNNALKEGRPLRNQLIARLQQYDRENKTSLTDEVSAIPAEARAYAYEFWKRGELQVEGRLATIFKQLQQFFERIANLVRGLGFKSMEDIFTALDRGQFAERESNAGEGAQYTSRSADYLQSPAFKKWFGDSKVVDAEGKPLVVYRGDKYADEITEYLDDKRREFGIFLTPEKSIASIYAHGAEPRAFYVSAEKVLDLRQDTRAARKWVAEWAAEFDEWIDRRSGEDVDPFDEVQGGRLFDYEGDWSGRRWRSIQRTASADGYDAVWLLDHSNDGPFDSLVVFRPTQIKSAIGNVGTFDPNNPDIRFSQAALVPPALRTLYSKAAIIAEQQIRTQMEEGELEQLQSNRVLTRVHGGRELSPVAAETQAGWTQAGGRGNEGRPVALVE